MTGFEPRVSGLEATALPTEPKPLPENLRVFGNFYRILTVNFEHTVNCYKEEDNGKEVGKGQKSPIWVH